MDCWFCGHKLIWQNDYELNNNKSMMSVLTCSNDKCGATFEGTLSAEGVKYSKRFKKNKPKRLPTDLIKQLDWAKTSLIGKSFKNKKTGSIYYVKGITVDTETSELRVIYVDGVSINEWDRPLSLFIEKFIRYKGERNEQ